VVLCGLLSINYKLFDDKSFYGNGPSLAVHGSELLQVWFMNKYNHNYKHQIMKNIYKKKLL